MHAPATAPVKPERNALNAPHPLWQRRPARRRRAWLLFSLLGALLLGGCGGGGGGGGTVAETPPPAPPAPTPPPEPPPEPARFVVSGSILPSAAQVVDSDTNDPSNPLRDNSSLSRAQSIPNPITVGGYVSLPGEGAEGQLDTEGDSEDFYRVELLRGQVLTLLVADFRTADADLYLFDEGGALLDFSLSTQELETLVAPRDGTYFVNVSAFSGATNYSLSIGSAGLLEGAALAVYREQRAVIPGEVILSFRESGHGHTDPAAQHALNRRMGLRPLAGEGWRAGLLQLEEREGAVATARLGRLQNRRAQIPDPEQRRRWQTLLSIKALARDPAVASVAPNYRLRSFALPNDEYYPLQWHYPLIALPAAWELGTGSPEVIVAVIDTGILGSHPDLRGQTVPGFDFVRDIRSAGDGDGIDPDPEEIADPTDPAASDFHGSHVIGTVAARGNNRIGVSGVAPGVRVMPLRALGSGGEGTSYDVLQAVRFAAGLANDSGTVPARPADIINLSLGGEGFNAAAQSLYDQLRELGIVVVAAAGNEGSSSPSFPAAYQGVFSVSAVDAQRQLTGYSNRGSSIWLAAPGGDGSQDFAGDGYPDGVLSTAAAEGEFAYTFVSGTSMAAPHVAGVFALMKSINPALVAEDFDNLLRSGELTDDLGPPGRDDSFGFGLINARKSVEAALRSLGRPVPDAPRISASSSTLNFGSARDTLELVLDGSGGARVIAVESTVPWAQAEAQQVDAAGLGSYRVSIFRQSLPEGIASGELLVRASPGTLRIRLIASKGGAASSDLGTVYVLLYDPQTDEVIAQSAVRPGPDGVYAFSLPPAAAGRYQVVAGTDLDNDLTICDAGEACGALLTVEQPQLLELDRDRQDVVFPVEYQIAIPSLQSQQHTAEPLQPVVLRRAGRDQSDGD